MQDGLGSEELRELYRLYAPVVYRRAAALLGNSADAWDAVQEVFQRMLESSSAFRGEARPMTYVYRVATNVCLNALRSKALRSGPEWTEGDEPAHTPAQAEARQALRALARELDERCLQVAALTFLDGLTQDEIAQVLDVSRKTVVRDLAKVRECAARHAGAPAEAGHG
jgi:RNA polymerase sigma-70 factor (ECF subfamily)